MTSGYIVTCRALEGRRYAVVHDGSTVWLSTFENCSKVRALVDAVKCARFAKRMLAPGGGPSVAVVRRETRAVLPIVQRHHRGPLFSGKAKLMSIEKCVDIGSKLFARHDFSHLYREVRLQGWEHVGEKVVRLVYGDYDIRMCSLKTGYFEDVKTRAGPRASHWRKDPDFSVVRCERKFIPKERRKNKPKPPDKRQLGLFDR
jgi:hypothetical protein